MAGQVEAVGKNVKRFQPGDEVFGWCKRRLRRVCVCRRGQLRAEAGQPHVRASGGRPVSALTALQALRDHGKVQPGQKVLIIGASGGVGTFAVQIAKSFGAEVTGVCSTRNVDMVRSIGADHVIDYTQEDFTKSGERYDLILDIAGNRPLSDVRRALTAQGDCHSLVGGRGGPLAHGHGSLRQGARVVTVREPEPAPFVATPNNDGPGRPEGAHRSREGHTGHRQNLPAERDPRGHRLLYEEDTLEGKSSSRLPRRHAGLDRTSGFGPAAP